MKILIIILLLLGLNSLALATDLPTRIDISYQVSTDVGHGELHETMIIKQENGIHRYHLTSKARATGILKLVKPGSIARDSQGTITEFGLQPERFSDKRGKKIPSTAVLDWQNNLLRIQHKGQERITPLPEGTLDRLSFSYNFMFSPPAGDIIEVSITDGRNLRQIKYTVDKELLATPIGELDTIVLTKQLIGDDKRKRKIWFAITHHMLPVRIISTEKSGLELEKMVSEINMNYSAD